MSFHIRPGMAEAVRLTREGRLGEATALIQRLLRGEAPPPDATTDAAPDPEAGPPRLAPPEGLAPRPAAPRPAGRPRAGLAATLRRLGRGAVAKPRPAPPPVPEGARFDRLTHAGPAGARDYLLYVPASAATAAAPLPLVVMLHGCTQTAEDFAAGTRMNALAEAHGVLVAYPEQPPTANAKRCWNWFEPAHQGRGGEPSLVAGIVAAVAAAERVDPARVFVAGLSAGGAAAAVLGAAYPELFAAVGVHSGLPAGAARDVPSAFAAMRRAAPASAGAATIPTIVFHGDADPTVDPANGAEVLAQAAAGQWVEHEAGEAGGRRFHRALHRDAAGRIVGEHWTVVGAGHAWSGGSPSGSYADPAGPDASAEMLRFFLAQRR